VKILIFSEEILQGCKTAGSSRKSDFGGKIREISINFFFDFSIYGRFLFVRDFLSK